MDQLLEYIYSHIGQPRTSENRDSYLYLNFDGDRTIAIYYNNKNVITEIHCFNCDIPQATHRFKRLH